MTPVTASAPRGWTSGHLASLLCANVLLSLGAVLVRLADTGSVAAGFWRIVLASPVLLALAWREPLGLGSVRQGRVAPRLLLLLLAGGVFFGLDIAAWHMGIEDTKLGNAALFGNAGSLILMVWGVIAARRAPRLAELLAIAAALGGATLLMAGSLEISHVHLVGDLLCLLAGLLYAVYILMLNSARRELPPFTALIVSMVTSAPVLLAVAIARGEAIMPHDWTPLILLALSSQIVGQGLLVRALKHFPPLVIGLALLIQPAVSALTGWLAFGESLTLQDVVGMALLAAALVLARLGNRE